MTLAIPFLCGYLLDLVLGDPPGWPHPVRALGWLISRLEAHFYQPAVGSGAVLVLTVLAVALTAGTGVLCLSAWLHPWLAAALATYLLYAGLATRSLHLETRRVEAALDRGDLEGARARLAMIVSRETGHMEETALRRATLETLGENLNDGIVAPMFFVLLAGIPGLIAYKAVNTLDSMVGYKNDRYERFGKAAARLDDVLNFLPARLTALLICLLAGPLGLNREEAWRVWHRDGGKTASPNAGRPMAALAGALGVRLGGPARYFGRLVDKPYLGEGREAPASRHYEQAVRLLYLVSAAMAGLTFAVLWLSDAGLAGLLGLLLAGT